jgi:hypothetical protein
MPKSKDKTRARSKGAASRGVAAASSTAAPAAGGTPFALQFGFLTPDNRRKVEFGMLKAFSDDNKPFFVIVFVLSDLVDGEFQERVKVDVRVGDFLNEKAQAMIDQGLTLTQQEFLRGPITTRAKALPKDTKKDPKLSDLNNKLVDMTTGS